MKRALFFSIPLLVALFMVITVMKTVNAFPLAAKQELEKYIQHIEPSARPERIVRASRPWNFKSSNLPTYGDNWYFDTDHGYDTPTETVDVMSWQQPLTVTWRTESGGAGIQLSYPAQQLWCVALHSNETDRVLLLALHHEEPHGSNWVIHQGPEAPFSGDFENMIDQVGCGL
ncbi:MAG: hypothetical protein JXA42_13380 [Anaerolineales bacterium]|nr:hypothetical protein [Anaerolineales bacterium]